MFILRMAMRLVHLLRHDELGLQVGGYHHHHHHHHYYYYYYYYYYYCLYYDELGLVVDEVALLVGVGLGAKYN